MENIVEHNVYPFNDTDEHSCNKRADNNEKIIRIAPRLENLFEILILNRHHSVLETASNQFGFKPRHGTDQSVFVLKQVIYFYKSNGSPLYLC